MDPLNNNTQVEVEVPVPSIPPVVPPAVSEPQSIQEQLTPTGDVPKGSSMLMKFAIWILAAALLVAVAYVVYANFFAKVPANTYVPPTPTVEAIPTPVVTDEAFPTALPTSTTSATPISTPTSSPSASPGI